MADDVSSALPRKNYIQFGDRLLEVTDPACVQPVVADVVTDLRVIDGQVWLSVGYLFRDGDADPVARVNARLRIPLAVALDIQAGINTSLAALEEAKKSAN